MKAKKAIALGNRKEETMMKMWNRIFSVAIAGGILLSGNPPVTLAKEPDVVVKINGVVQSFDTAPIIKNGRVLVPFRKIFEVMGAQVDWDPKNRMVTANKYGTQVVLRIGDPTAYIIDSTTAKNFESPVKLDAPTEISNGRTLVPLRFVSESFNAQVEWAAKERTVSISTAEPAAFLTDKGLEQAIRNTLNKPNGPLTKEDMAKLEYLNIMSASVDLKGLEFATNLKHLFLNANQVAHLETINSLAALEELSLDNVQTKDIGFLAGLRHLHTLRISGVPVSDITPVGTLPALESLTIAQAPVQDIRALSALNQLETLDLEQNQITDLSPLQSLTQLKRLAIYKNPVKDASPLQNLTSLTHLHLADTAIADGTPLAGLTNLQELGIPYSHLKSIEFATNLTQLQILHVAGNQIQSVPSFSNLKQLNTLFLDENPIQDIASLAGLPALEKLYINNTKVSAIDALATLPSLKEAGLFQIPIDWNKNAAAMSIRKQLEQKGVDVRL
ncbi:leucine-rich repeat domain-containing protein [Brevibacillus sp. GCM10020057]|uniref:leucine-rich repeat domain-containing protein n=1 Tax=Brevibacillus sp. GCM10020057 TaxID=3317327 RepID=UPI00362F6777